MFKVNGLQYFKNTSWWNQRPSLTLSAHPFPPRIQFAHTNPDTSMLNRFQIARYCLLMAALLLLSSGCVHRRMTVRSNPSGALVEVDGERIGITPVAMDFTYYGTHEITLSMPGYETLTVQQPVKRPLSQYFPIDFVSNHFLPQQVTDRHDFTFNLARRQVQINDELNLINRAQNFRSQSQVGVQ